MDFEAAFMSGVDFEAKATLNIASVDIIVSSASVAKGTSTGDCWVRFMSSANVLTAANKVKFGMNSEAEVVAELDGMVISGVESEVDVISGVNFESKVKSVVDSKGNVMSDMNSAKVTSEDAECETKEMDSETRVRSDVVSVSGIAFSEAVTIYFSNLNTEVGCVMASDTRLVSDKESESGTNTEDRNWVGVSTEVAAMLGVYTELNLDWEAVIVPCKDADARVVSELDCKAAMLSVVALDIWSISDVNSSAVIALDEGSSSVTLSKAGITYCEVVGVKIALILDSVIGILSRENFEVGSTPCFCSSPKSTFDTDPEARFGSNSVFDSWNVSDVDPEAAITSD